MPERSRTAWAMISAIDDGVGQIRDLLKQCNLDKSTLIILSSDIGATLGITEEDLAIKNAAGKWDDL